MKNCGATVPAPSGWMMWIHRVNMKVADPAVKYTEGSNEANCAIMVDIPIKAFL